MAFFITVITGDLTELRPLLATTLAVLLFGWSCICLRGRSATFSLLLPLFPVLFFFLSSLLGLLGSFRLLSSLFGLGAGFFLGLRGYLVSLIVPRIETHL